MVLGPRKISTSEGLTLVCECFVVLLDWLIDFAKPHKPSHRVWFSGFFVLPRNFRSLSELERLHRDVEAIDLQKLVLKFFELSQLRFCSRQLLLFLLPF